MLKENAARFMFPLLAIAIFSDVPFHGSAEASAAMNMAAHAFFAIAAAVIGPVLFDNALFFIDRFLPEDAIFGCVGLLLLTFCLYGVSLFYHGLPPSPFNPAWHLAAGCYAFFLFERNELFASIRAAAAERVQRAVQ
ncbi:hypothetical protein [Burkholderia lata]|uniref:hypothetical protein n=1 Tax=Burkholderia lata (strain ATCC 17760 / DSM 23089 / LMG 22485 / NCIMB 9086 / R18194 / 383) TaxID=482957 RepID=UPI001581FA34|nr:hypothetical protein [Burkholderia lata]